MKWLVGIQLIVLVLAIAGGLTVRAGLLEHYLENQLSQALGRDMTIAGDLSIAWRWPPAFRASGLRLANAGWSERGPMLKAGSMYAAVAPESLLGRLTVHQLAFDRPRLLLERRADGSSNWQALIEGRGTPPVVRNLTLNSAEIVFFTPARDRPLTTKLDARLAYGNGRYRLKILAGQIGSLKLAGSGNVNPGDPASIQGELKVGRSNLTADLTIDRKAARPRIAGTLESKMLAVDELSGLIGNIAAERGDGDLIPDVPIYAPVLRQFDAAVTYRAAEIGVAQTTANDVHIKLELTDGRLQVTPAKFRAMDGQLRITTDLHGRKSPVNGGLEVDVDAVALDRLPGTRFRGAVFSRVDLEGQGATLDRYLANARGRVAVYLRDSRIDKATIDKLGLDVLDMLGIFTSSSGGMVDLDCAAAHFDLDQGVMHLRRLVIMGPDTSVTGSGTIHLPSGRLDLHLDPQAERAGLLEVTAPVGITGTLRNPELNSNIDVNVLGGEDALSCPDPGAFVGQAAQAASR